MPGLNKGRFLATEQITPGCEWVINGEGVATRKWDGTCCMIREGALYKRHEVKNGKAAPIGFLPAQDPDPITGNVPGWLLVGDGPEDALYREAFQKIRNGLDRNDTFYAVNGTYELVGPKVNGNKDKFDHHQLIHHGIHVISNFPRTFDEIKNYLLHVRPDIEGVVWWHPDGRHCKIKRSDFGLKR